MLNWLSTWLFNPALGFGAAAVASPILIHLLSRRRFRRVRWAAMDFLLQAHTRNRRRVKMEQLILLLLRCLAVLLLVMMVARPFIRPSLAADLLGGAARTERIIVLDDSYSMGYRTGGRTVFENGAAAVSQIARWIGGEMPRDSLTMVLSSNPEQPLLALPSLSEANLQQLAERLRTLAPTDRPARPAEALASVAALLRQRPSQANASVYVVSDFQRVDWTADAGPDAVATTPSAAATGPAPRQSPIASLADVAKSHPNHRLVLIDVSADKPQNVAITDVQPISAQIVAGTPSRFAVEVANHTDSEVTELELSLSLSDQALPPVIVPRIPARGQVTEPIEVAFPHEGFDYVRVGIAESGPAGGAGGSPQVGVTGLLLDNVRAWSGAVLAAVNVLIVNGDPNPSIYDDEVYYLKTALRPEGQYFSGNEVRVVEENELETLDLSTFPVIILANVYRLTETGLRALERYVAGGGGLIIFAGNQIDAGLFNDSLYVEGRGLSPVALLDVVSAPASLEAGGFTLGEWDEHHPMLRSFSGPAAELLRRIRFNRFLSSTPHETAEKGPSATQPGRPAARVVARLNDPDHMPLIVERPYARGNVMFVASTADRDWNEWPADPSYVPFVLELVSYAAGSVRPAGSVAVGDPIQCRLDPNQFAPRVNLRLPGDETEAPVGLDARPMPDGGFAVSWDATEQAGVYKFELTRVSGESEPRYAAVNPVARESDLTPAGQAGLTAALPEMKFEYFRDLSMFGGEASEARRELWWPLLMAAVAALMLEHGLAWWFGARK